MWIGEQRISLRNMSKNQRAYWREMKRIYEEATQDGFNMTGQEFIETYAPEGNIRASQVQEATQLTGEQLLGYENQFDQYKAYVDNLIQDLGELLPSRKSRRMTKGQETKIALANTLEYLVNQYGYEAVYMGWMSLPYEIRAKIDSTSAGDRYDGSEGALDIIEGLVESASYSEEYEDYDGPEE